MPNNNENNNDNLFTQMFGLESEQPTNLPQTNQPQPKPEPQPVIAPGKENIQEQIVIRSTSQQNNTFIPNALENSLNLSSNNQSNSGNISNQVTISPTKKEEIIELTSTPQESEQKEENEIVEEKFNPNAIPTEPYDYQPQNVPTFDYDEPLENASNKSVIGKTLLIFLGVIVLIGGWIMLYSTVLAPEENPKHEYTPPKEEDKTSEEETESKKDQEQIKISFDQSMSFYKGLTDDPNELNREYPFEPAASTGVIKCELKEPIKEEGTIIKFDSYLYYENYLLKKSYLQQITTISNKSLFNQNVDAVSTLEKNYTDTESLTFDSKVDYKTQTITLGMFSNLAYGSYSNTPEGGMIMKLKLDYDDSIKSAMATIYGLDGMIGNIKCSSVKTS